MFLGKNNNTKLKCTQIKKTLNWRMRNSLVQVLRLGKSGTQFDSNYRPHVNMFLP